MPCLAKCAISRSTTSRRVWLRWIGPSARSDSHKTSHRSPLGSIIAAGGRLQALWARALDVVGLNSAGQEVRLEAIAARIGPDLCLFGLGVRAVISGRPVGR